MSTAASGSIDQSLVSIYSRLGTAVGKIWDLGDTLESIATLYENTEQEIVGAKVTAVSVNEVKKNPVLDPIKKGVYGVTGIVSEQTHSIVSRAKDIWGDIKEAYDSHGKLYYAVQYGKAAVKTGLAIAKIAGSVSTLVGTFGVGTVPAVCGIVSGLNDIWNVTADVVNLNMHQYDQIGKVNLLKDTFDGWGQKIGGDTGARVGRAAYYGIDLVGSLAGLSKSIGKLNEFKPVTESSIGEELQNIRTAIGTTSWSSELKGGIQNIKYQIALAKYAFPNVTNRIENIGKFVKVASDTKKVVENEYKFFGDGASVESLKTVNDLQKSYGKVGKAVKCISTMSDWYAKYISSLFTKDSVLQESY